jgi:hypothetical protein
MISSSRTSQAKRFALGQLHLGWIVVFCFNLVFPILFGWGLMRAHGRGGMFPAIPVLLAAGYWICSVREELGRLLIIGGALVGRRRSTRCSRSSRAWAEWS